MSDDIYDVNGVTIVDVPYVPNLGVLYVDSQLKRTFEAAGTIQTVGAYTVFVGVDSQTAADLYRAAHAGSIVQGSNLLKVAVLWTGAAYAAVLQITSQGKDETDVQTPTVHHGAETVYFDGVAKTTIMEGDPYNAFSTFGANTQTDLTSYLEGKTFVGLYWALLN